MTNAIFPIGYFFSLIVLIPAIVKIRMIAMDITPYAVRVSNTNLMPVTVFVNS